MPRDRVLMSQLEPAMSVTICKSNGQSCMTGSLHNPRRHMIGAQTAGCAGPLKT